MTTVDSIGNDEYVLRHIPDGTRWRAPGPRITSANFDLRHDQNETGVSVTRLAVTTPERLLELVGGSPLRGSRVAQARKREIEALGFRVVPRPLAEDLGHSEIQSHTASLDDPAARKRLAAVFQFLP